MHYELSIKHYPAILLASLPRVRLRGRFQKCQGCRGNASRMLHTRRAWYRRGGIFLLIYETLLLYASFNKGF